MAYLLSTHRLWPEPKFGLTYNSASLVLCAGSCRLLWTKQQEVFVA